jgi:uncharacterized membrane protein YccC
VEERVRGRLFDPGGTATRLRTSPLLAIGPSEPGPALRRGFLLAVPVGLAMFAELGFSSPTKGAIATGALFAGFPGMDAPAKARAGWQAVTAPLIGLAAALGVISGVSPISALPAIAVVGAASAYCFAVSLRFAIFGLTVCLSLLVAQGLPLEPSDWAAAFVFTAAGGVLQALFSLIVYALGDRSEDDGGSGWNWESARASLRADLNLDSVVGRHAIRFGATMAAAVATYWILDFEDHGYWIPLTILFVMRPEKGEAMRRIVLRAVGTAAGLAIATALSFWLDDEALALALVLAVAAGFAYGLLTVEYALFTAAITVYVVILADNLGEPELSAAGHRALATAIGLALVAAAFALWPNREEETGRVL